MNATLSTIESPARISRFTNIWLAGLMTILGLTTLVTAILVSWPLVAYISSRLFV